VSVQVPWPGAVRVYVGLPPTMLVSKFTSMGPDDEWEEWHVLQEAPAICICSACKGNVLVLPITIFRSWHLSHNLKLFGVYPPRPLDELPGVPGTGSIATWRSSR
jgi:hypothetical protein